MREGKLILAIRRRQFQTLAFSVVFLIFSLCLFIPEMIGHGAGRESPAAQWYPVYYSIVTWDIWGKIVFSVITIFAIFLFVKTLIPCLTLEKYKNIKRLGHGQDSKKLLSVIAWQCDLAGKENTVDISGSKRIHLAKNWMVLETRWNVDFFLADDLLWVFKQQAKTNDQFLVLHSRYRSISTYGKGALVENALKEIQRVYPWVVTGYSQDRKNAWYNEFSKLSATADKVKAQSGYQDFSLDREYGRLNEWTAMQGM